MQIYLTEKEAEALRYSATEWCSIMSYGDEESCKSVDERLDNGLGSAFINYTRAGMGKEYMWIMPRKRRIWRVINEILDNKTNPIHHHVRITPIHGA